MKNSIKIRIICLIVALVVLSGAVVYAAFTGSPYETLKTAILDAAVYRNVTVEGSFSMSVNGIISDEERLCYSIGDNSHITYSFNDEGNISGWKFSTNGLDINPTSIIIDNTQWYFAYVQPHRNNDSWNNVAGLSILSPEDRNSSQIRFVELLTDAIVGDLKNNVTMSISNGVRTIRGTLTESQIPELINVGLTALIEQSRYYDYYDDYTREDFEGCDPLDIPMKDITINYVTGEAEINSDGDLQYICGIIKATLTDVFGDANNCEININVSFTDIGTSSPVCPIPGAEQFLTSGYINARFSSEFLGIYFTLNKDGSINEKSITTTYPRELF